MKTLAVKVYLDDPDKWGCLHDTHAKKCTACGLPYVADVVEVVDGKVVREVESACFPSPLEAVQYLVDCYPANALKVLAKDGTTYHPEFQTVAYEAVLVAGLA